MLKYFLRVFKPFPIYFILLWRNDYDFSPTPMNKDLKEEFQKYVCTLNNQKVKIRKIPQRPL